VQFIFGFWQITSITNVTIIGKNPALHSGGLFGHSGKTGKML
jgi:hypothetical protein